MRFIFGGLRLQNQIENGRRRLEAPARDIVALDVAGMVSVSLFLDNRLEAVMLVGHIVNDPFRAVRFV